MRASMAQAGAKLKASFNKYGKPAIAKASTSYKRMKRATSTKNIPADVKGLKRLRAMNKKQLAAALFKKGGKGTLSLAAMFGATAAIDALGTALATGSPEPVIADAGNRVLDKLRDTAARAPATPRGAAAQIAIGMLADRTTGRFNMTGFIRSVRTGGRLLRRGPTAAEIRRRAKKAYGRKYRTPEFRAFGSGSTKKKKKTTASKRRRKSYRTYDVFA